MCSDSTPAQDSMTFWWNSTWRWDCSNPADCQRGFRPCFRQDGKSRCKVFVQASLRLFPWCRLNRRHHCVHRKSWRQHTRQVSSGWHAVKSFQTASFMRLAYRHLPCRLRLFFFTVIALWHWGMKSLTILLNIYITEKQKLVAHPMCKNNEGCKRQWPFAALQFYTKWMFLVSIDAVFFYILV